jgi:HEPN domain-containing protein
VTSQARSQALALLDKARQDLCLLEIAVPSPVVSDEIIGFHAQQAVEKAVKAVLCSRGTRYRRTHDIAELIDLLDDNAIARPGDLDKATSLSPFAVELRYDFVPSEPGTAPRFDRAGAQAAAAQAVAWATGAVSA